MNKTIVIAAISSRVYVQAAVDAGFEVIALDAFADVDTKNLAKKVIQIDVSNGQFNSEQLLATLTLLKLSDCMGFAYGAGFEAQPELLCKIALIMPIIGNTSEVITQCKQPSTFFALCEQFAMPYPETVFEKPNNTLGWLQKKVGASGGEHIKALLPINLQPSDIVLKPDVYYQQKQAGTPVSCLFLADGSSAQVVGFNEQWCSPTLLFPYRFGGAVSQIELSEAVQHKLTAFVMSITKELGLKGLNSCDCIVHDEDVFMLEINPRLSASVGLYEAKRSNLFEAHVASCLGRLSEWPIADKQSRAMQIIYANKIAKVPLDMDWPEWVCDIPQPNSVIPTGMPICSVMADARTAKLAKQKVLQRAASL
ncbi:MAG: ATP-grasp domain-containing protein [Pseudomonadota bacterium]